MVSYAPGASSRKHHHAGSVLAYVLSGEIASEKLATGPVKVYKAGKSFFEPPGSKHLVSETPSATRVASLLAVSPMTGQLTTFDRMSIFGQSKAATRLSLQASAIQGSSQSRRSKDPDAVKISGAISGDSSKRHRGPGPASTSTTEPGISRRHRVG